MGLYGWIALVPHHFSHELIVWLVVMQFILVEMVACSVAVFVGVGLARRKGTVPWYADPRTYSNQGKARDPRQIRLALLGLAAVLLVVVPTLVFDAYGDWQRSWGVAGAFLPRVIEAWQVRDADPDHDPGPARALAMSGFAGWGLALLCLAFVWILGATGAPVALVRDGEVPAWSRLAGAVILLYYLGMSFVAARLKLGQDVRSPG